MARPEILQQLRHDKILTKGNFPKFVETFNYAVNRVENIKGDYDTDPQNGHIKFDTTDPEHPVIRMEVPYTGSGDIQVDTDVATSPDSNSIQKVNASYGEFIQLLDFNGDNRKTPCKLGSATDFLIREKTTGSSGTTINLDYIAKQYVINPLPDTTEGQWQSLDIQGGCTYQGQTLWQLYNFTDLTYETPLGCTSDGCCWVVLRNGVVDGNANATIDYAPIEDFKIHPDS